MTNQHPQKSNEPSHHVFQVRDRPNADAIWTRIGAAWKHADDKGLTIQIDTVPLDGKILLREPMPKAENNPQ